MALIGWLCACEVQVDGLSPDVSGVAERSRGADDAVRACDLLLQRRQIVLHQKLVNQFHAGLVEQVQRVRQLIPAGGSLQMSTRPNIRPARMIFGMSARYRGRC